MQDAAQNFLRHARSLIEAAGRGNITEEDLAAGRNAMNELLELDWVMPKAVAEVSIQWTVLEQALRAAREDSAAAQALSEDLQAAWAAYHDIEGVFNEHA
jgi:hypothetical protein